MAGPLDFTNKQAAMLHRLLYDKTFEPNTREQVARWLTKKKHPDSHIRAFVTRLIALSCLRPCGLRLVRGDGGNLERKIYDRDTKHIKEVWQQTSYDRLSFAITDDERVVL